MILLKSPWKKLQTDYKNIKIGYLHYMDYGSSDRWIVENDVKGFRVLQIHKNGVDFGNMGYIYWISMIFALFKKWNNFQSNSNDMIKSVGFLVPPIRGFDFNNPMTFAVPPGVEPGSAMDPNIVNNVGSQNIAKWASFLRNLCLYIKSFCSICHTLFNKINDFYQKSMRIPLNFDIKGVSFL